MDVFLCACVHIYVCVCVCACTCVHVYVRVFIIQLGKLYIMDYESVHQKKTFSINQSHPHNTHDTLAVLVRYSITKLKHALVHYF